MMRTSFTFLIYPHSPCVSSKHVRINLFRCASITLHENIFLSCVARSTFTAEGSTYLICRKELCPKQIFSNTGFDGNNNSSEREIYHTSSTICHIIVSRLLSLRREEGRIISTSANISSKNLF